jgi:hypothetical protein
VVSAYIVFGWPSKDRRSSCIAADKWGVIATYIDLFLGYYINSRTMMVTWPLYKQEVLLANIQKALESPHCVPPKVAASIMGKVRAAGNIAPWGPYISFSLADAIKKASRRAFHPTQKRKEVDKRKYSILQRSGCRSPPPLCTADVTGI